MQGPLWVREFREFRDSEDFRDQADFREQALAEFELALINLQRFDLGLESRGRNS